METLPAEDATPPVVEELPVEDPQTAPETVEDTPAPETVADEAPAAAPSLQPCGRGCAG